MDAAEQSFARRGYRASTMEVIAAQAGYSRAGMYRQFPTRKDLVEALVERATLRKAADIAKRLGGNATLVDMIVESLIIVGTELVHDPLIRLIDDHSDDGTVANIITNHATLTDSVTSLIEPYLGGTGTSLLREGLRSADVAQFLISTSVSLLLRLIPGTEEPSTARRYIEVFVLPAILRDPPRPCPVFVNAVEDTHEP